MAGIEGVLRRLEVDLGRIEARWALVGGLAVSVRSEPRTTRDLDVVIAVTDDREAQSLVHQLKSLGYRIEMLLEQETAERLATVRLLAPGQDSGGIVVDLLFASSGVEPEIVDAASRVEILEGVQVPVASIGHLLAVKFLAGRPKDLGDIEALAEEATLADLEACRSLLTLIQERGFHRNVDLLAKFSERFDGTQGR